jgi:trehalose 6-phosphate synthase
MVVANRLPIEVSASHRIRRSPGGLASALGSVTGNGSHWVGWPGSTVELPESMDYDGLRLHPVAIDAGEYRNYYGGFANSILWPLFHGRLRPVEIDRTWWGSYRIVNQRFATAVARFAPPGASVWVHDYHLLLVPAMIRARRPDVRIGSFLHIPFPNAQLFATLPWRRELLLGMADADVIGFQTQEDVHNFTEALERMTLGSRRKLGAAKTVDAFPISVDFDHWAELGEAAAGSRPANRALVGGEFIFLGVDRLDYTKGIGQRLRAYGELLDEGRLDAERCTFVQFAVPTRSSVPAYREERQEVESLVEAINAKHTVPGHEPVHYRHVGLDEKELTEWYCSADALVITSLADGMNLVAKEFVASRTDLDGSVVLSEFTGAANDLPGALVVNPFDIEAIKDALLRAVAMMPAERRERMSKMRAAVQANDVSHWARSFLDRLEGVGVPLDTRHVKAPIRRGKRRAQ